jgi:hypothetical protein
MAGSGLAVLPGRTGGGACGPVNGCGGALKRRTVAVNHSIQAQLHPFPALFAVHAMVAAYYSSHLPAVNSIQLLLRVGHKARSAFGVILSPNGTGRNAYPAQALSFA